MEFLETAGISPTIIKERKINEPILKMVNLYRKPEGLRKIFLETATDKPDILKIEDVTETVSTVFLDSEDIDKVIKKEIGEKYKVTTLRVNFAHKFLKVVGTNK